MLRRKRVNLPRDRLLGEPSAAIHAGQYQRVVFAADKLHGNPAANNGAGQGGHAGGAMKRGGPERWWRRLREALGRSHPAQAVAEFALVITPCLTLFFGIINFALALYCYDFVCYSAQQAVRYATVHGSTATTVVSSTDVTNYVKTLVVGVLTTSSMTVTTTWSPDNKPGSIVT